MKKQFQQSKFISQAYKKKNRGKRKREKMTKSIFKKMKKIHLVFYTQININSKEIRILSLAL